MPFEEIISSPGHVPVYCPITTIGIPEDDLALWSNNKQNLCGSGYDVLVIDDDHFFRGYVSRIFAARGLVVLAAGCPLKAMEYVAAQGGPKRLVVTDYRMPGACGDEVAKGLIQDGFDRPIVLMSDEEGAVEFVTDGVQFVSKRNARSLPDFLSS